VSTGPAATMARVTAIVVLYNSSAVLGRLLESIPDASRRTRTDVVVVDNASEDREESRRVAESAGARFVQLERNVGYGSGVNAAVSRTDDLGEFILICNADLRFEPGAIDALADYAGSHPGLGSLGPAILNEDGTVYPSARRSPSLRVGIGHALLGDIAPRNRWSQRYRDDPGGSAVPREADWLSGACLLVPAERFSEIGGFDEGYFMYFEDVDLADRLSRRGWLHIYAPSAVVVHEGGHATRREPHRMQRVHHTSALRYLSRRYRGARYAPLRAALRGGLGARMVLAYISGRVAAGARPQRTTAALKGTGPLDHERSGEKKG
jgi:N-acetylglucosaminyl-diphospho-decaprenol L-rhamnosyltransferase